MCGVHAESENDSECTRHSRMSSEFCVSSLREHLFGICMLHFITSRTQLVLCFLFLQCRGRVLLLFVSCLMPVA
ncbi:hypothetical protein CY34DRAFT_722165 [Suillus luteus UH-Slu-Lm8-n1]|uniref:Uncharacterized protein n=1 Tax=Suillus luteus UH-Slu-Lm8-n1 TaxID=930992 RepID=A0A0D0A022_9AGAM|nr:hypothetical protein CY34DRAFT_722165 [Suillus luteus UH-Slu-Lm8-n1]